MDERRAARKALLARIRMILIVFVFLGGLGKVVGKAWDLQIVQADELREMAERQYVRRIHLPAKRGAIYDRSMNELAVSVGAPSVFVNGRAFAQAGRDPAAEAGRIASVLEMEAPDVQRALTTDRQFLWLRRWIPPEQAEQIRQLAIPGVEITQEARRYYPNRELASHILGFAGIDSQGLEGLERQYDELLRGQQEGIQGLRDARGRLVFSEDLMTDQTPEGNSLVLTIDRTIQHVAEVELAAAIRTFEARAGMVVVVDPRTGEILAIANEPDFNPNNFSAFRPEEWRNRAIHDMFEPGSTFKIFTIAAALNAGVIRPDETVFCENGRMEIADYTIHDSHRDGWLSVAQVLQRSSNIGAARIALELGRPQFYRYIRRFGFGERTELGLPGETPGRLSHWHSWYDVDVATIAFGQGVGVSTLQLAMATAAIADGGRLHRPLLVRRILGPDGSVVQEFTPEVRRRVVSRETARLVADMMTGVTEDGGTGIDAALDGYLVAGKTGTAQVADPVHGGYAEDAWIASFVGFVPADRPRLAMAVVLVEPVINHYGGQTAGPVFRRIADQALRYLGVPPNRPTADAPAAAAVEPTAEPSEGDVEAAEAAEAAAVDEAAAEEAAVEAEAAAHPEWPEMPDFSGMSMRRALQTSAAAGLAIIVEGTGRAVDQAPRAGRRVDPERRPVVRFEAPAASPIAEAEGPAAAPAGAAGAAPAAEAAEEGASDD
jgi:cell division protein FtsI (penicillin-binding protein 3)